MERLAPGLLSLGGEASTPKAVDLLMQAVMKQFPQAIRAFAKTVRYPAADLQRGARRGGKGTSLIWTPSPALRKWCRDWNLTSESIYWWAVYVTGRWEEDPDLRSELHLPPSPLDYELFAPYQSENPDEPLAPVGAMPNKEEGLKKFLERATQHWEARVTYFSERGFKEAPLKADADHFDWFVRFQCGGENLTSIAVSVGRDVTTVSEAVKLLAKHVQVVRRPRVKSGRPRKRETRKV